MLAGLLFAFEEATEPVGRLVATLPFAGTTLIEHQARQLVAAGAGQIVVIGEEAGPEVAGALHRVARRGVAVDAVHSVAEAAAKVHPLSRVMMLADGLVAADATVAAIAQETGDALLVVPLAEAPAGFERIGGASAWAGIAQIDPRHLAEVAAMPADYAPQSTLLRVVEAAGAARVPLSSGALLAGHGIERGSGAIEQRGRRLVAAAVATRHGWFDRIVTAPLARLAMPILAGSAVTGATVLTSVALVALLAGVALIAGWPRAGMMLAMAAMLACTLAAALAMLRDDRAVAAASNGGIVAIPFAAELLLGRWGWSVRGDAVPFVLAIALVAAAAIGMRAIRRYRSWWGSPPAYALIVTLSTLAGWPTAGLAVAALYAGATLAAAVEAWRGDRHA